MINNLQLSQIPWKDVYRNSLIYNIKPLLYSVKSADNLIQLPDKKYFCARNKPMVEIRTR